MCSEHLAALIGFTRSRRPPLELEEVRSALQSTKGKILPAARLLGVSRWTVDRVLKRAEQQLDDGAR